MFNADPKLVARLSRHLERSLIVEPNPNAARLLADLLKEMGGRQPVWASTNGRALELAREYEPQMIFTEYAGPDLDGPVLVRRLRRSELHCRRAPVIMITATATAVTIKTSRDSGVHEFLRKPFTAGDLSRRIENVALKPRDWIEAQMYVGPDRRRFNSEDYAGQEKRGEDPPSAAQVA